MESLRIGQLAKRANVHVETLRYYERRGLLDCASRTPSGYRQYSQRDVGRIQAIRAAQQLGFTLSEIRSLLPDLSGPHPRCTSLKQRAARKLADLDEKIQRLTAARDALARLVASCTHERAGRGACSVVLDVETR